MGDQPQAPLIGKPAAEDPVQEVNRNPPSSTPAQQGRFPKFVKEQFNFQPLVDHPQMGFLEYCIVDQTPRNLTIAVLAPTYAVAVGNNMRNFLYDNRQAFQVGEAGIEKRGAPLPIFQSADSDDIVGYRMEYRFTFRVV